MCYFVIDVSWGNVWSPWFPSPHGLSKTSIFGAVYSSYESSPELESRAQNTQTESRATDCCSTENDNIILFLWMLIIHFWLSTSKHRFVLMSRQIPRLVCRGNLWTPSKRIILTMGVTVQTIILQQAFWHDKNDGNYFRGSGWAAFEKKWILLALFLPYAVHLQPLVPKVAVYSELCAHRIQIWECCSREAPNTNS